MLSYKADGFGVPLVCKSIRQANMLPNDSQASWQSLYLCRLTAVNRSLVV